MIERTVTIKSAQMMDAQGGKQQYLATILVSSEGRESKKAIFDPNMQKVIQQAYKENKALNIKLEKEGNFWNIKEAQVSDKIATVGQKEEKTWKPAKNDDDILLSVAFKGAIELERHHYVPEGKINTGRVIQTTSEIFAGLVLMRPKRGE